MSPTTTMGAEAEWGLKRFTSSDRGPADTALFSPEQGPSIEVTFGNRGGDRGKALVLRR
jgi:hypothetical protein